jgi:hypothetical protein
MGAEEVTAFAASTYVMIALAVFLILEYLYTKWAKKPLPSWVTLPWIASYALVAGFWVSSREWWSVGLYLFLAGIMTLKYFRVRKSEKKDTSWKEMFR